MATRLVRALGAALLGLLGVSAARSEPLRILYAEPFQLQSTQPQALLKPGPQSARVNAFGRVMSLALEDNSRLLRAASPQTRLDLSSSRLLKGSISGIPGSWVRLTLTDGAYSGAIWDGSDLYLVEPRATVEKALIVPLAGTAQGSAIFRLADTQGGAFQAACGVDSSTQERVAPLANYGALVRELQAAAVAAPREIEVALVADYEFTSRNNSLSLTRMLSQVNVVDGIFGEQVGVAIIPTDFVMFASDTDPFTSSDPVTLLEQFGEFRERTPAIRSRGLAHLMTGRRIDGNVIGIAYLGALCAGRQGVGLSEVSFRWDTPLIMAHELGHNFGAPHDAEPGSPCATTPRGFLMEPQLNSSSTFSTCSLQRMQSHIAGAACVVAARTRDVAVSVPAATIHAFPNVPFDYVVDISSAGDTAAVNVALRIPLVAGLQVQSFSMPGEDCPTTGEPVLACDIPELPAGETRRLTARLSAPADGEFTMTASATSTNDASSTNDSQTVQISVVSGRDFQVMVAPQPLTVAKGDQFEMTFDVAATGSRTLTDVRLEVSHGGLVALAGAIDSGTCTVPGSIPPNLTCTLPTLVPGVPRRLRAQLRSNQLTSGSAGGNIRVYEAANIGGQRITPFVVHTVASRDISVTTSSPIIQRVATGFDATWTLDVQSTGINPANDVTLVLTHQSLSSAVTIAVDQPIGATCTLQNTLLLICPLGTMAPGSMHTVRVRARAAEEADVHVTTRARLAGSSDDDILNDRLELIAQVRFGNDVSLQNVSGTAAFEENDETLRAIIRTLGLNASQNVVVTATLPSGFQVISAELGGNSCPLQPAPANVVACSLAQLPSESSASLAVRYRGGAPGLYTGGRLEVSADADVQSSNNSQDLTFTISPYINGELVAPGTPRLRTDVSTEVSFRVTTNNRILPDARVDFSWLQLADVVATAPGVTCAKTTNGLSCPLGTLAANSDIPITLRLRGVRRGTGFLNARLVASADSTPGNNGAFLLFETYEPGDAMVVMSNRTLIEGERTSFGVIINVTTEIHDVALELEYDASRLVNIAAVMGCPSMPTPHRCDVSPTLFPGTYAVELSALPVGIGPVPITVRLRSLNDANPANDLTAAIITIDAATVSPPPPPPPAPPSSPPPSSGGGGGGGAVEWPLALMLAMIWLMRRRRVIRAG